MVWLFVAINSIFVGSREFCWGEIYYEWDHVSNLIKSDKMHLYHRQKSVSAGYF